MPDTSPHRGSRRGLFKYTIMKNTYKILIAISVIILFTIPAFAQGGPPATPIDGGLSLLLAAGGAYGVKKLRDRRK